MHRHIHICIREYTNLKFSTATKFVVVDDDGDGGDDVFTKDYCRIVDAVWMMNHL